MPRRIQNITWWGGYLGSNLPTPSTDNFTIRLFSDNNGTPGALVLVLAVGNDASRTATGDFVNPPQYPVFPGRAEFKYSFNLPQPFLVNANTRYWLTIDNVPNSDSWVWEVSGSQINLGVQRRFSGGPWEPYFDNTAFQIIAVQEGSPPLTVRIDIRPHSFPNTINLGSHGIVPVAILSTATFNARTVNPVTVTLASAPVKLKGKGNPMASVKDVNNDGLLDLVVYVETEALLLSKTDTQATLQGLTYDQKAIAGTDSVRIVP